MSADSIKSKNLLEAIQKGREDEVEARLSLGEDVNSVFVMNRTPLHCAVANKMTRIVDKLLKHKPDITVSINQLWCPVQVPFLGSNLDLKLRWEFIGI